MSIGTIVNGCVQLHDVHVDASSCQAATHTLSHTHTHSDPGTTSVLSKPTRSGFIPPVTTGKSSSVTIATIWEEVMGLTDEMIGEYHLNVDQSLALKQCAEMFNPQLKKPPITLIHGMYMYIYMYTVFLLTYSSHGILVELGLRMYQPS